MDEGRDGKIWCKCHNIKEESEGALSCASDLVTRVDARDYVTPPTLCSLGENDGPGMYHRAGHQLECLVFAMVKKCLLEDGFTTVEITGLSQLARKCLHQACGRCATGLRHESVDENDERVFTITFSNFQWKEGYPRVLSPAVPTHKGKGRSKARLGRMGPRTSTSAFRKDYADRSSSSQQRPPSFQQVPEDTYVVESFADRSSSSQQRPPSFQQAPEDTYVVESSQESVTRQGYASLPCRTV